MPRVWSTPWWLPASSQPPMAALTRARAGTVGQCLVINLPGSPRGAQENLEAVIDLLPHVMQLLEGDNRHH